MANDATPLRVSVCHAESAGSTWQRALSLPAGATVDDALRASGFA
ncbi:RnfH family protein, partial [Bordetella petrii]|nr:RnfH family protein [Bordetella petrii]